MRYNSESLKTWVLISGNDVLFNGIKISLGLLIATKNYPFLFGRNHNTALSTTANNRTTLSLLKAKIPPNLIS